MAIAQDRFGPVQDVLRLQGIDVPAAADDMVLVRVHATSIHVGDTYAIRGVPYLFRPKYGLRSPKQRVPGTDVAGTVESVGRDVMRVQPGVAPNREDLATVLHLVETGAVIPVIDTTYSLEQTAEAIEHVCSGHTQGTTVIVTSDREEVTA